LDGETLNKILLSFIIPTFNSERTIEKCLSSIPRRDDLEVIVVDNYSCDSTVKICEKFDAKVYQIKGTRSQARNYGVEHSHGKYVMRLDSDEIIPQKTLNELMAKLKKYEPEVVVVRNDPLGYWQRVNLAVSEHYNEYFKVKTQSFPLVFRRELFLRFKQITRYGEDWEQWKRMEPHVKNSLTLNEPILHLPIKLRYQIQKRLVKVSWLSFQNNRALNRALKTRENIVFYVHRYVYVLKNYPTCFFGALFMAFTIGLMRSINKILHTS
jgi:glycosyltransferase involved in cell wall biosynthesis